MAVLSIALSDARLRALQEVARRSGKPISVLIENSLEAVGIKEEPELAAMAAPAVLPLYLQVVDKNSRAELGYVGELSQEGLLLVVSRPLALEQLLDLLVRLPETEGEERPLVEVQVETRWLQKDPEDPHVYHVGCQFAYIQPKVLALLQRAAKEQGLSLEDRRSVRKSLLFYPEIRARDSGALIGHLGDLSGDGLMILASDPIPPRHRMSILVKLPCAEELKRTVLELEVETRWTRPDVNPALHLVGCRFVKLEPRDVRFIRQVQDLIGFGV